MHKHKAILYHTHLYTVRNVYNSIEREKFVGLRQTKLIDHKYSTVTYRKYIGMKEAMVGRKSIKLRVRIS